VMKAIPVNGESPAKPKKLKPIATPDAKARPTAIPTPIATPTKRGFLQPFRKN
jgi:hypothetical protein